MPNYLPLIPSNKVNIKTRVFFWGTPSLIVIKLTNEDGYFMGYFMAYNVQAPPPLGFTNLLLLFVKVPVL